MNQAFESHLLAIIGEALASEPTSDTFRRFESRYRAVYDARTDAEIARVKHLLFGQDVFELPDEYIAALDSLLSRERRWAFLDINEWLEWTVNEQFEITDQDRADGYRSLPDFWSFLSDWRDRYRDTFGR